jgi:hypothetical protein
LFGARFCSAGYSQHYSSPPPPAWSNTEADIHF